MPALCVTSYVAHGARFGRTERQRSQVAASIAPSVASGSSMYSLSTVCSACSRSNVDDSNVGLVLRVKEDHVMDAAESLRALLCALRSLPNDFVPEILGPNTASSNNFR